MTEQENTIGEMKQNGRGQFVIEAKDPQTGKVFKRTLGKQQVIKFFFQKEVYLRFLLLKIESEIKGFEEYKEELDEKLIDSVMKDEEKTKQQKLNWIKAVERYKAEWHLTKQIQMAINYVGMLSEWRGDFLEMLKEEKPKRHAYLFKNYDKHYGEYREKFQKSGAEKFLNKNEDQASEDPKENNS